MIPFLPEVEGSLLRTGRKRAGSARSMGSGNKKDHGKTCKESTLAITGQKQCEQLSNF